jgi:hypothetical protein
MLMRRSKAFRAVPKATNNATWVAIDFDLLFPLCPIFGHKFRWLWCKKKLRNENSGVMDHLFGVEALNYVVAFSLLFCAIFGEQKSTENHFGNGKESLMPLLSREN